VRGLFVFTGILGLDRKAVSVLLSGSMRAILRRLIHEDTL